MRLAVRGGVVQGRGISGIGVAVLTGRYGARFAIPKVLTNVLTLCHDSYMTTETTATITNVFVEEAEYGTKKLISVVYSDGRIVEKRLSGAAARSFIRAWRARVAA